jgi:hypothetical protein
MSTADTYDDEDEGTTPPEAPGASGLFTAAVIVATLVTLFAFVGLVALAYFNPGPPSEAKTEPTMVDPAIRLQELRAKNQAVLDGPEPGNAKQMPVSKATADVVAYATGKGELPFPAPPPGQAPAKKEPPPEAKKDAAPSIPTKKPDVPKPPEKAPDPPITRTPSLEPAPAPRAKK